MVTRTPLSDTCALPLGLDAFCRSATPGSISAGKQMAARKKTAIDRNHRRRRRGIGRPSGSDGAVGRDALLAKTCELLKTLPPERVTRAEVARYTNVDPSLIRYYFQDRASLLVAAAEEMRREFDRRLDAAAGRADDDPRSLLRARVAALFDLIVEQPYFHRLLVEEIIPSAVPAARKIVAEMTGRILSGYEATLRAGVRDGSLRPARPIHVLLAVIGMCESFGPGRALLRAASKNKLDEKAAAKEYRDFVCDLVVAGLSKNTRK
jgi:TetR/AcrR family transcriptional regulator